MLHLTNKLETGSTHHVGYTLGELLPLCAADASNADRVLSILDLHDGSLLYWQVKDGAKVWSVQMVNASDFPRDISGDVISNRTEQVDYIDKFVALVDAHNFARARERIIARAKDHTKPTVELTAEPVNYMGRAMTRVRDDESAVALVEYGDEAAQLEKLFGLPIHLEDHSTTSTLYFGIVA